MTSTFLFLLVATISMSALGLALAFRRMHDAPEGYEDQDGFHYGCPPARLIAARQGEFADHAHVEAA